jgi:dephospho-CoA kinase
MQAWREEGKALAVVVIPLLFETQAEASFDAVACVACSAVTQRERLSARGWTVEQIERRNAAQLPVVDKMLRSSYVIWTEGGLDVHAQQWERILSLG